VPQTIPDRSQPLVGRTSPYREDIWRRYCCLTVFFRLSIHDLVEKTYPDKVVRWCADGDFPGDFLRPAFTASRVQHVSDVHPKFALRRTPCLQVWQTSNLRPLRLGEEKSRRTRMWADALECGLMPNVMAALPNIGGALCSTPQTLAEARCWSTVQ